MKKRFFLAACFFAFSIFIPKSQGQIIILNELVSSNKIYLDNFYETPDWLELFNAGMDSVDLTGMGINDELDFENAWKFDNTIVGPGEHLLIFASGKDISSSLSYNTLINQGDEWKYTIPMSNLPNEWRTFGYDDSEWLFGPTGIGYGDGDDNTIVPQGTRSIYMRKEFTLELIQEIKELLLHIDYDDAFIAYLNGDEAVRSNIGAFGEDTGFNAVPHRDHEAQMYRNETPDLFNISSLISNLVEGTNVLAIQLYNISANSSDLTIIPFLTVGWEIEKPYNVPEELSLPESSLHTDFKLSSRGETVYLFHSDGTLADSITFPEMPTDFSFGRIQDGHSDWVIFESPTPNSPNGGAHFVGLNSDTVRFSHTSGIYNAPIMLELNGGASIRYTLDAREPTEHSNLYVAPIPIENNTLVRARIFEPGLLGKSAAHNYLFNISHTLPIISLNTEHENLWDNERGMYVLGDSYQPEIPYFGANFWEDWEYPFRIDYFDSTGDFVYAANAGAKIFGGWSRAFDPKSFSLFARAEYGTNEFHYPFFAERPYSDFESIILRNSGNDWDHSYFRDAFMSTLLRGSQVDFPEYQPVSAYLNGEYWGMYNMREKINEHFIASLHGVDADDVDLLESNAEIKHGDNKEYLALRDFIENYTMANHDNYEFVMNQVDEINFIQYQVAQIYYNNMDWPGNNVRYWKANDSKWRWILYDTDFGLNLWNQSGYLENTLDFATASNGPNWPNPPWSTLFLRKFLENPNFKRKFVNYFADFMNSIFLPGEAIAKLDALVASIEGELLRHKERWGQNENSLYYNIATIKNFLNQRPAVARNFIRNKFQFPASNTVNTHINNPAYGSIQLNSLYIKEANWSGVYFQNNLITLTAVAQPGHVFERWSGDIQSTNVSIELNPTKTFNITAHFKTTTIEEPAVVINEINYNSLPEEDVSDWVELHNFSSQPKDISGWILKDDNDNHSFIFPSNTILQSWGFLVVCRDLPGFQSIYQFVDNAIGGMDFGLSSDGDAVRLFTEVGDLHDEVYFLPFSPWPEDANGKGPTLELISPELDNALASNWKAYPGLGTPGQVNHLPTHTDEQLGEEVIKIFPNPTTHSLKVMVESSFLTISSVRLVDNLGIAYQMQSFSENLSSVHLDLSGIPVGNYILILTLNDGISKAIKVSKI